MKKHITFPLAFTAFLFWVAAQNGLFAQSSTSPLRSISVKGIAEREVVPDEIYVEVHLREYTKKNGDKINIESIQRNFLAACKSMGLPDSSVIVQGYEGWDGNYWWYRKNKKQNPDMKAGIRYWVKVNNPKQLDELVQKLDDEATENFFIAQQKYSKEEALRSELKAEAVKNARTTAIKLAEAINEQVGHALTINEPGQQNYPVPMYSLKATTTMAEDTGQPMPMEVDFKKIKLRYEVNVVFELK